MIRVVGIAVRPDHEDFYFWLFTVAVVWGIGSLMMFVGGGK